MTTETDGIDNMTSEIGHSPIEPKLLPEEPNIIAHGEPEDGEPIVLITQHAYTTIERHAKSNIGHEVGGAMIGCVHLCPRRNRHYITIEAAIAASLTKAGPAHVTFTHDTWAEIWRVIDDHFPEKLVLGWYHSHPGLGVFLSGRDVFVHRGFFPERWQVALVVDPVHGHAGFFRHQGASIKRTKGFYVITDSNQTQSIIDQPAGSAIEPETGAAESGISNQTKRTALRSWSKGLLKRLPHRVDQSKPNIS